MASSPLRYCLAASTQPYPADSNRPTIASPCLDAEAAHLARAASTMSLPVCPCGLAAVQGATPVAEMPDWMPEEKVLNAASSGFAAEETLFSTSSIPAGSMSQDVIENPFRSADLVSR